MFVGLCVLRINTSDVRARSCSIVTCAVVMKSYVEENVSQRSCASVRHMMKMFGSVSETLIFFFLGVVTVTTEHEWNWGYVLFTLLFAFLWRCLGRQSSDTAAGFIPLAVKRPVKSLCLLLSFPQAFCS